VSAAARITADGGAIFVVSECSDGLPDHGKFGSMFDEGATSAALLGWLRDLPKPMLDQWQVQILSEIRTRCDVALYSSLDEPTVRRCKLDRVTDLQAAVEDRLRVFGGGARAAVLPEGPLTIPYVRSPG
jgi:hypothetical protein